MLSSHPSSFSQSANTSIAAQERNISTPHVVTSVSRRLSRVQGTFPREEHFHAARCHERNISTPHVVLPDGLALLDRISMSSQCLLYLYPRLSSTGPTRPWY